MHVLIITSEHYLPIYNHLSGIFQHHQAIALENAGYQVGVLSTGTVPYRFVLSKYPYQPVETKGNIIILRRYIRRVIPKKITPIKRVIKIESSLGIDTFNDYIKRVGKPDIIHAHNVHYAGIIAAAISEKFDIPFLVTEHSSAYASKSFTKNELKIASDVFQKAAIVSTVSNNFAELIKKTVPFSGNKTEVIPNILDSSFESKNIAERKSDPFVFLNIASLNENKDQTTLIKAFSISFRNKNVILKIGGNGNLLNQLKKLALKLDIEKQVMFLGLLSRDQVKDEMSQSNCFVLSSRYETFGVVLIEALACGNPLIATACGGPEDIVNKENGILVQPGDINYLSNAMNQVYENYQNY
ncbi:MAG: glycosyltransferase, partial [Ignavibacteria bacterium]|nr:glycosyltransferase [Ignavibacteria bacterium]